MMAQYLAIKEQAGDALLFYRMGDFYELFFADAEVAAAALDIALTKRGKHAGEDIPMCGVPAATAESYLAKLIEKGFRVAVCEQTEDPKEAKKRGSKAPVRREIVRVVTPGTITEEGLLDARAPAWIAALSPAKRGVAGLAWADVTTGAFAAAEIDEAAIAEEIAALAPRELLHVATDEELDAALARTGGASTLWPAAKFDERAARGRLEALFKISSVEGLGDFSGAEVAAAGALADYLELTQAGERPQLASLTKRARDTHMAIDPATRASLEIERTLSGARRGSLLATIDRTVTAPGARALADRLSRPLLTPSAIDERLDAVSWFVDGTGARARRSDLRDALKGAGDPARALSRLMLGRGGPRDLAALAAGLRTAQAVSDMLAKADAEPPAEIGACLSALAVDDKPEMAALAREVEDTLNEEPPVYARDGGFVREGVDAALDEARKLRDESRRIVAGLQAKYAELSGVSSLKVRHNNQIGYFVEVTSRHGEKLLQPDMAQTFIHRQTMANALRFSTQELSELESKIASAGERALAREMEIFNAFVARASELAGVIREVSNGLAALDCASALAAWAEETGCVRPEIEASRAFEIEAARHPVVEAALAQEGAAGFTPNDCRLDGDGEEAARLIFVTGPNMAGKSTFLRQNALIALLAQAGSYVPAKRARIGVVDRLFSRVGASDDLSRGRSTFMAEMIETAAILNQSGAGALVILDEIGRGTATFDGLAIAWATAEHLHDVNHCRALFATHYHELTKLADTLPAAANVSLRAKEWNGELVFLHEVGAGPADRSYGVEVARRAGLPRAAVARAREVLKTLEDGAGPSEALEALPLFAAQAEPSVSSVSEPSPVDDALAGIDPDALSPREALDIVYRLKQLADERG